MNIKRILGHWPGFFLVAGIILWIVIANTPSAIVSHTLMFRAAPAWEIGLFYTLWIESLALLYLYGLRGLIIGQKEPIFCLLVSLGPALTFPLVLSVPFWGVTFAAIFWVGQALSLVAVGLYLLRTLKIRRIA